MLQALTPRPLTRSCQSPVPRSVYSREKVGRFRETVIRERRVNGTAKNENSSAPARP